MDGRIIRTGKQKIKKYKKRLISYSKIFLEMEMMVSVSLNLYPETYPAFGADVSMKRTD